MRAAAPRAAGLLAALALAGCAGIQSALAPRGIEAAEIDPLFWTVTWLCIGVLILVMILMAVAVWGGERWRSGIARDWVIIAGGIVFPLAALSLLLFYGLVVLQAGSARTAEAEGPGVRVVGKRWWWEVVYVGPDGDEVVSANELRLPVGAAVPVRLESDNVIHSFWVPHLAGKLDMIPGRTNVLTLQALEEGVSRGQCAEYCGGAHALMAFYVAAMPQAEYDAWLAAEAAPAAAPQTELQRQGQRLFLDSGCGGCHAIRGTPAQGEVGPDLTHLGGRMSLGAGILPNTAEAIAAWIVENQHLKPENLMPPYDVFDEAELGALSAYLESLE